MKKKSVRNEVVTKGYLTDELAEFRAGLIDQMDQRIDKKFDKVHNTLDKIVGELQDMREENAAGIIQERRLQKQVDNHEKRIKILEASN